MIVFKTGVQMLTDLNDITSKQRKKRNKEQTY